MGCVKNSVGIRASSLGPPIGRYSPRYRKVGIPDAVLNKPFRLTAAEMVMVATHPVIASDLVTKIDALARLVPIIKRHHERYDGTGYPDGLKVEEIPLGARVLAVADGFEAMTPSSLIVRPRA